MATHATRAARSPVETLTVEFERETDGVRWLADVPELPGVMAYGKDKEEALLKVKALALRVLADNLEDGELDFDRIKFAIK